MGGRGGAGAHAVESVARDGLPCGLGWSSAPHYLDLLARHVFLGDDDRFPASERETLQSFRLKRRFGHALVADAPARWRLLADYAAGQLAGHRRSGKRWRVPPRPRNVAARFGAAPAPGGRLGTPLWALPAAPPRGRGGIPDAGSALRRTGGGARLQPAGPSP